MRKFLLSCSICIVSVFGLVAQNRSGQMLIDELTTSKPGEGKVTIYQDPKIEELVGIYIEENKKHLGVEGYRIQLFSSRAMDAKNEADKVKVKLLSLYPNEKIYIDFEAPIWRVQVGNFRSKNESLEVYKRLKLNFPDCYPVKVSNVHMSEL